MDCQSCHKEINKLLCERHNICDQCGCFGICYLCYRHCQNCPIFLQKCLSNQETILRLESQVVDSPGQLILLAFGDTLQKGSIVKERVKIEGSPEGSFCVAMDVFRGALICWVAFEPRDGSPTTSFGCFPMRTIMSQTPEFPLPDKQGEILFGMTPSEFPIEISNVYLKIKK